LFDVHQHAEFSLRDVTVGISRSNLKSLREIRNSVEDIKPKFYFLFKLTIWVILYTIS